MDRRFQFDPFGPGDSASDGGGPDLSGIDFNDPASFMHLLQGPGLPIPKTCTPEEARALARTRSRSIIENYHLLHDIVSRHEATIQRRWAKKGTKQRLAIIVPAWGSKMAAVHRPDFDAFKKESPQQRVADGGTRYRDSFLWPYINQEDLSGAKTLPLLLNARARHPPSAFAGVDGEAMHVGHVCGAIVPIFLNEWTMMLNGITKDEDYGRLVAWDEDEDAATWCLRRKQYMPGEGLLILEAQQRLMAFLVKCCRQILHDIPKEDLVNDAKFPVLAEPTLKSEVEVNGFESLAVMAAEAPYRLPARIDLERVESLLAARLSATEDHLWALREDPGYLIDTLADHREHRQEQVLDGKGKRHPVLDKPYADILWIRCISGMLTRSFYQLEAISELHEQAKQLRALHAKYGQSISPMKDLPDEYLYAILKFRYFLSQTAKGPQKRLSQSFPPSPPVRNFWRRIGGDGLSAAVELQGIPSPGKTKMDRARDDLWRMLSIIWEDGRDLFLLKLTTVVDELNRLIESEPLVKNQVSSFIAYTIGFLSVLTECTRQLENYQPWANSFDNAAVDHQEKIEKEWGNFQKRAVPILKAVDFQDNKKIGFGDMADGRYAYPIDKRRTKENVEALRRAEANLDDFWAAIDKCLYSKAGNLKGTALGHLLSQDRVLQRTPEWVEPPRKSSKETTDTTKSKQPASTADADLDFLTKPLSAFYFGKLGHNHHHPDKTSFTPAQGKTKIKTKGTSSSTAPTLQFGNDPTSPEANPVDPQPTFAVDARALKVFRTLFFNPSTTSTPGEVAWTDFLHALTSTGFAATKLYGSVWQFRPTGLDVERPIQIHEPHPGGKIPFVVARRHGRRLNRAYGWFAGMFVLKEKRPVGELS